MCRTLIIDEILNTKYLIPDDMPILMDYNDDEKIEVELPIERLSFIQSQINELPKEVEKKPTPKCGCCNEENDLNNMVKCEGCNSHTLCKICYEEREEEITENHDYYGMLECPCCDYKKPCKRKIAYDNFRYIEGQEYVLDEDTFKVFKKNNGRWGELGCLDDYRSYHSFEVIKITKNSVKFKNKTTGKNLLVKKDLINSSDWGDIQKCAKYFNFIHNGIKYEFERIPEFIFLEDWCELLD